MPESKKNSIIVMCSLVGCIVTLLTCGILIGNIQGTQGSLVEDMAEVKNEVKSLNEGQSEMKSEQSYLKGVVNTKLDTIQVAVTGMQITIDDLLRAD